MLEKKLRSLLLNTLGTESYLGMVSSAYILLIKAGFLKDKYPELIYLKDLVKPGDTCVDIGANVGYYSVFLSNHVGKTGHVYAVEPVPMFSQVFLRNTKRYALPNITLYPCALGSEVKMVTLGTPVIDGVFRHGLTHVLEKDEVAAGQTYQAQMEIPDELFGSLSKIDFLKCDVEGYEVHLFPHLIETLKRCKPTIQIEISGSTNRSIMLNLLEPIGYGAHKLHNHQLIKITHEEALQYEGGDFYFLAK